MFRRFFHRCWTAAILFFCTATPLFAQQGAGGGEEGQVWVLSFLIMITFLALTLLILLRPTKRSDSAFSYDEVQAQKEEEMQKIQSAH